MAGCRLIIRSSTRFLPDHALDAAQPSVKRILSQIARFAESAAESGAILQVEDATEGGVMTPDQLTERYRAVLRAMEEAAIPNDVRVIAFELGFSSFGPAPATPAIHSDPPGTPSPPGEGARERVVAKLGVASERIDEVFVPGDDGLELVVPASKLERGKAGAAKQLALLVAAGRQATGDDDGWTSAETIRRVVDDYGKFDSSNFASTLSSMHDVFTIRGRGRDRSVRVTRQGFEAAAALIERVTSE